MKEESIIVSVIELWRVVNMHRRDKVDRRYLHTYSHVQHEPTAVGLILFTKQLLSHIETILTASELYSTCDLTYDIMIAGLFCHCSDCMQSQPAAPR